MSRFKKKKTSWRNRIIMLGILLLVLFFAWKSFTTDSESAIVQTGSIASGDSSWEQALLPAEIAVLNDQSLTGLTEDSIGSTTSETTNETLWIDPELSSGNDEGSQFSGSFSPLDNLSGNTWSTISKNKKSEQFPVHLCNQIINLYECIISRAPIENQTVMRDGLKKSIETRHLMASSQLSQVCQNIHNDTTFQLVRQHYATGDQACSL